MQFVFDTNLSGPRETRRFWGTLCEDIKTRMWVTPTGMSEMLRRVLLETEREWDRRLRRTNRERQLGFTKTELRRLTTTASTTARNWMRTALKNESSPYRSFAAGDEATLEREDTLYEEGDERLFDLATDNGIRDRKIVVEALARDVDLIISNNIQTLDHPGLQAWIAQEGSRLPFALRTSINAPEEAEVRIRTEHGRTREWISVIAVRAAASDFKDTNQALDEVMAMVEEFDDRGMPNLRTRILRELSDRQRLHKVLEAAKQQGKSQSARLEEAQSELSEQRVRHATVKRHGYDPW